MSKTIDERVVEMRFDNQQFERNVSTSMSTLAKLKQSLNLTGASKGLENVQAAANRVDFSGMTSNIDGIQVRFSYLQASIQHQLNQIVDSAVNAGKRMASALTIDPIKTGFSEYETQINAVQTILANTESKGTTLGDVNKALDTLNTYADKTIYNFTEMTRNIGTFTAAGVDLDTSVNAIQGIANLAAVSGSTSQQASTAMYQLSQALANGKVNLMDWNSVVNAGMGGEVFQTALKRTAKNMGTNVDAMIEKYGSFRESLTQGGWLTTEVLTETLGQLAGAYTEADLLAKGYSKEQATDILKLSKTAEDAATKVKTFTQLWDTLKEAAQSGWTQTWEIIVGDFEEAKALLTNVSNVVGKMIGDSAEARNALLQGWKDAGGRAELIEALSIAFDGLLKAVAPIKEAFTEIFPPLTVDQLMSFTKGFKGLMESFSKFTSSHSEQIKAAFKGIFSIASLLAKGIGAVAKAVGELLASEGFASLVDLFFDVAAGIGNFFTSLNEGFSTGGLSGGLSSLVTLISDLLLGATDGIRTFGDMFAAIGRGIVKVAGTIWDGLETVFTWITENISAGDIFAGLTGGGIFVLLKKFAGLFGKIQDILDGIFGDNDDKGGSLKEKFGEILDSVGESLQAFTAGIKVASLVGIAVAVGILSASLKTISELKVRDISKSLFAIASMLTMLNISFSSISKTMSKFDTKGIVKSSVALILIAASIGVLADAMVTISELSLAEIAKGLIGVGGGLAILCGGLKVIGETKVSLSTSVAMLALAESCKILGDALQKFSGMSWGEIARGLTAMGGAMAELVVSLGILSKFSGGSSLAGSVSIFITVQSLSELADALAKFGKMKWKEIGKGITAMGGALLEVAGITGALGKIAGVSSLFASGAILMVIQGLGDLADAFKKFAEMSWEEIEKGFTGMGSALSEVAIITGFIGKLTGLSGLLGGGAILIAVQSLGDLADAFKKFGGMAWEEIGKGLTGLGGALFEVALMTGVLGKLTGLSGLLGAGALLVAIQGLGELADAFKKFGGMSWEEIGKGLTGMGGALLEVSVITGVLGAVAGLPALLGSGAILVAVQGLGELADALAKFGSMSWDEIGRGLTAMGAALGELALGGFLNTLSIIGSFAIAEMAEPLGVLADSVKKWKDVQVPDGLGGQLLSLATGIQSFTFAGLGALAISEIAVSLGDLAGSVKKWYDVTVPEGIGAELELLANGIKAFTWGGMGASAIADLGLPLGDLADSVKKWAGVTVPENIGDQLTKLADGVKAFSWAFMGSWSIDALAEPLGDLAGAVKKWKDVNIPDGLNDDLTKLADAVKSFTFAFVGGWSIDAIKGPLGDLANTIKKWNGVDIPADMGDKLKNLASGLWSFTGITDISVATSGMKSIASSAERLNGLDYATTASGLKLLAGALSSLSSVDVTGVESLKSVASTISSVISSIKRASSQFTSAGTDLMSALAKGLTAGKQRVNNAIIPVVDAAIKLLKSTANKFKDAGIKAINEFAQGISINKNKVRLAATSSIASAVESIRAKYSSFYSAGSYLVDGFAAGISANSFKAAATAAAMAKLAIISAEAALGIKSPSRVFRKIGEFVPKGFALGIERFGGLIKNSTVSMADTAINTFQDAINRASDAFNGDMNAQPTIRPVLDLSEISAGAGSINGMFDNPSLGVLANVGAIGSMVNNRQNGSNDIISAIDRLGKTLGNMPSGDTYNIDGLSYDNGSDVAVAIQTIARAAVRERRV